MRKLLSMGRRLGIAASAIAALAALAASTPARAADKQACIAAADDAQQLRIDGRLKAARERLLVCARPECPPLVRTDCSRWMNEVLTAMPTVVFGARDAQGRDVVAADVSIDGVVVARGLDGKPIEVDPGTHTFRFESPAAPPVEQQVLIRESEKGRPITVTLAGGGGAETKAQPGASSPGSGRTAAAPTAVGTAGPPVLAWVFGGMGIAALGIGTFLELSVNAQASSLAGACGHDCSHAQVDPLVTQQRIIGPIAFGVGAASLGIAMYYFFFGRAPDSSSSDRASLRWEVAPSPGGAVGGIAGRF
jgi:hypothetical protein